MGTTGRQSRQQRFGALETLEIRRLMSAALSLNGPQSINPGQTMDVSNDNSFGQSNMVMDVNPTNPLNIVGFSQHAGGMNEIDVFRSFDGGNTWAKTAIDNGAVGTNDGTGAGTRFDPAIAFDDSGNLYIAYGNDIGASTKVVVARSTDGGATFGQFRTVATSADINNGTFSEVRGNAQFSLASGPDVAPLRPDRPCRPRHPRRRPSSAAESRNGSGQSQWTGRVGAGRGPLWRTSRPSAAAAGGVRCRRAVPRRSLPSGDSLAGDLSE